MILHHQTKFGKMWLSGSGDTERARSVTQRKYHPDKYSLTFWTSIVTLTLNVVILFFHRTPRLMMLYYQTKFGFSLKDTTEIVTFLLYMPSLWTWHWTRWISFWGCCFLFEWHSGLWCGITIPGLVIKCSLVQKISSGQTFTNICNLPCDLHLKGRNPIFPQATPSYDVLLTNWVCLKMGQQFEDKEKNSQILIT